MARKTISVDRILDICNNMMLHTEDRQKEMRIAASLILEQVLFETNNYGGFRSLGERDMKDSKLGKTPGIEWFDDNTHNLLDHTRRQYHKK